MTNAPHEYERYCRSCRHSLRGISSRRCPECGCDFDPNDPKTTLADPTRLNRFDVAHFLKPVVIVISVATVLAFAGTAFFLIDPMLSVVISLGLAPVFLLVAIASLIPAVPISRRYRVGGVVLPILLTSILWSYWPYRVTFVIHKPAMEQLANDIWSGQVATPPSRVGWYRFNQVRQHQNGNIGFQMTGDSGGGMYLVRAQPNAHFIWYNTNWEIALGDRWFLVYED